MLDITRPIISPVRANWVIWTLLLAIIGKSIVFTTQLPTTLSREGRWLSEDYELRVGEEAFSYFDIERHIINPCLITRD